MKKPVSVLPWILLAWALAWAVVGRQPDLWPIALLGVVQNIAFTFVSRGRNSGSLLYHLVAAFFSNGMYILLLFFTIDQVRQAHQMPVEFLVVYTLSTMSGSIFAHWLALKMEKGRGRNVQADQMGHLMYRVTTLEQDLHEVKQATHPERVRLGRAVRDEAGRPAPVVNNGFLGLE